MHETLYCVCMPRDKLTIRLENRLKMRHYALLLAIARHRSITRAASEFSISQPTLTRALADIEDIFMTPLFVRTRRGLETTPAGDLVLARARLVAADHRSLQQDLEGLVAGRQGRLRLGVIPYAPDHVLDATWEHLFTQRQSLSVLTHEDTTLPLLEGIRRRELDCAICRFSQDSSADDLEQELLCQQQAHLVISSHCAPALRRISPLDVTMLSEMDWIFPPSDTPIRRMIEAMFASAGVRVPVPVLQTYAPRAIATALKRLPRGVTVLPQHTAQLVSANNGAIALPEALPWNMPPVSLAWLRDSPSSEMARELCAAIRLAICP
ncbi:LysR family transcriptional regulator [Diaphorobacter sp.]|uniref:LysR family transcriptional regulator n=1 Tax=Diaphorobacter sp. TaxID=1934310 RepID=UPI0028B18AA8|nr:LysR family transcriptional regulator [Diaphorobacter sp.]